MRINSYASTGQAIQAPFTFYDAADSDWNKSHSNQLWNKNFSSTASLNSIIKTIYSPSPSGFLEPKTAAFTGFTLTGGNADNVNQFNISGSWNKGWNFYANGWKTGSTIFMPALGIRDTYSGRSGKGEIAFFGDRCGIWVIEAESASNGYNLYCVPASVHPIDYCSRSFGSICHSVKE